MVAYTPQIGNIWIRAYDEGVILALGSYLQTSGANRNNYFVRFNSGLSPNTNQDVPVIFGNPEQVFEGKIYPSYVISRDSVDPNLARWHSVGQMQENWGVTGTEQVVNGVTGFSKVRRAVQAWPFDISYTIAAYARYEYEAQTLLRNMMRKFPPRGYIYAKDSMGDQRSYECFNDSSIADISEIVDVSERLKGYSITLTVVGEIDLSDSAILDTALEFVINKNIK